MEARSRTSASCSHQPISLARKVEAVESSTKLSMSTCLQVLKRYFESKDQVSVEESIGLIAKRIPWLMML